jgi:hypothetical protein
VSDRATHPGVVVFLDLTGLPGWGSEATPSDGDTGTIVDRAFARSGATVRVVQGCTVLVAGSDVRGTLAATMSLLAEAARSSGSAVAGAQVIDGAPDEAAPGSTAARTAATLAGIADAGRLLVTEQVVASLGDDGRTSFAIDDGPAAVVDSGRVATFALRRR